MVWSLHIIALLSVAAYLVASLLYIRALWNKGRSAARLFLLFGALGHSIFLLQSYLAEVSSTASSYSLSLISLGVVLIFLLVGSRTKFNSLGVFVAPLGLGFFLVSSWIFHSNPNPEFAAFVNSGGTLVKFHIASTLLGNIFFTLTCAVSLALIFEERLLKRKKLHTLMSKLPSIATLDELHYKVLGLGFFLMCLGVISGVLMLSQVAVEVNYLDPRLLVSASTLFLLSFILLARMFSGFRGIKAAWLTVFGFLFIAASSIGLKYSESFHVY